MAKASLGSNIDDDITAENSALLEASKALAAENAELHERIAALTRANNEPLVIKPKAGERPLFSRIRIVLEDNDGIPPSGQFFGLKGTWVNPQTLEELEPMVERKELTRKEAYECATEKVSFDAYLRPGEPADVPVEMLGILNDAIMSIPILEAGTDRVLGYKDRSRYPYRVVTAAH